MKTPRFVLALFALTFALAPQSPGTAFAHEPKDYSARLISPRAGTGFDSWTSCEDSMEGGLSRRRPIDV